MTAIHTEWHDGTQSLVAFINKLPEMPPTLCFTHEGVTVAHIDMDGNLCIKGELITEIDRRRLSLVHANTNQWSIWPNPTVFYDGNRMTAFLVSDPGANHLQYPAFFWDEKDFYAWSFEENVTGTNGEMLILSTFQGEDGCVYTRVGIRGNVKKESQELKVTDETSSQAGQTAV